MTTFDYMKPNDEQLVRIEAIRQAFNACTAAIETNSRKQNREFALARTKMEEACMWAIKGIVWGEQRSETVYD
jgi:hypothetical protein